MAVTGSVVCVDALLSGRCESGGQWRFFQLEILSEDFQHFLMEQS